MIFGPRRRAAHAAPDSQWGEKHSADIFAYEMITLRQLEQDSMMWQTPALAITGQAFLLTLSFTADVPLGGRIAAAVLGGFVAIMSLQLMAKHQFLRDVDAYELERLEGELHLPAITHRGWAKNDAGEHMLIKPRRTWWTGASSYLLWRAGLWVFLGVNVLAVAIELFPEIETAIEQWIALLPWQ